MSFFWFDAGNKESNFCQPKSPEVQHQGCSSHREFSSTPDIQKNWTYGTPTKFSISDGCCAVNVHYYFLRNCCSSPDKMRTPTDFPVNVNLEVECSKVACVKSTNRMISLQSSDLPSSNQVLKKTAHRCWEKSFAVTGSERLSLGTLVFKILISWLGKDSP